MINSHYHSAFIIMKITCSCFDTKVQKTMYRDHLYKIFLYQTLLPFLSYTKNIPDNQDYMVVAILES